MDALIIIMFKSGKGRKKDKTSVLGGKNAQIDVSYLDCCYTEGHYYVGVAGQNTANART